MIEFARGIYKRNERWIPIAFFIAGFIFDAFMLRRVDELLTIVQQAAYIVISATLIKIELSENIYGSVPPGWLRRVWEYREGVLHFLMGTLLNAYTIFFFKSASAFTSFAFIALLVVLLTLNEFGRFGKSQTQVHVALLSLCLISYLITLVPILIGSIGVLPFLLSIAGATVCFLLYGFWLKRSLNMNPGAYHSQLVVPFASMLAIYTCLYFAHAIPPVPLSVRYVGIFHEVSKQNGAYYLSFNRPDAYFWQHGDQTFQARPGDVIYCFARVFSPARFKDDLRVRWLYYDSKTGWTTSDLIAFPVKGGREEGYRGVTKKINYKPGDWRVQIETEDGREVGRMNFMVVSDLQTDERTFTTIAE